MTQYRVVGETNYVDNRYAYSCICYILTFMYVHVGSCPSTLVLPVKTRHRVPDTQRPWKHD